MVCDPVLSVAHNVYQVSEEAGQMVLKESSFYFTDVGLWETEKGQV